MSGVRGGLPTYFTLSYSPSDEGAHKLVAFIQERKLKICLSQVRGLGVPKLKIGRNKYVVGVDKITQFLEEQESKTAEA